MPVPLVVWGGLIVGGIWGSAKLAQELNGGQPGPVNIVPQPEDDFRTQVSKAALIAAMGYGAYMLTRKGR